MVYITGDIHGDITKIKNFCNRFSLTSRDKIIILGDVGLNFFQNKRDKKLKYQLNELGLDIFCIHGNHEIRPEHFDVYKIQQYCGGQVFVEEEYPNIIFAKDGEIYDFEGKKTIVCGGAYSVDKWYRICKALLQLTGPMIDENMLEKSLNFVNGNLKDNDHKIRDFLDNMYNVIPEHTKFWWPDEQPSDETKKRVEKQLEKNNWNIDIVLTHTGPTKYEPVDMFLSGIDQSIVDKTTEYWLDTIEDKLKYRHWYAGHYHVDRKVNDKFTFLFNDIVEL